MSFFDNVSVSKPNCIKCGLDKKCRSPRMGVVGSGKKKILLIVDAPDKYADISKTPLANNELSIIRAELHKLGINLFKDCWILNAVQCMYLTEIDRQKGKNRSTPTPKHIEHCKPFVLNTISKLNPDKILIFGDTALQSFYRDRNNNCTGSYKMGGLKLWDSKYKAWVFPIWSINKLVTKENYDKLFVSEYRRVLIKSIEHSSKPLKKKWNPIHKLITFKDTVRALKCVLKRENIIAIDYETTGLTMFKKGHKTVSFAWATDKGAWSILVNHPNFTKSEQKVIVELLQKILSSKRIKKIVQGITFEYPWTKQQLKAEPTNFFWDTQLASHVLDNRTGITGLKFQAFVRWGIEEYDNISQKYIHNDPATGFNRMEQMPVEALLEYNALDALYTYELYKEQLTEFVGDELKAYKFFHRGALALCEMTFNGIKASTDYYKQQRKILVKRRNRLVLKIEKSKEAKKFYKKYKKEFDYNSPKDLQKMLFKVLKLESIKQTKTGDSVDEEVLSKLNIPLTDNILKIRKIDKTISTYIDGFIKNTHNGALHPTFALNTARSFRSCIAGYEKILVVRRSTTPKHGIPIKDIKVGDMVYCFNDKLEPVIRPVVWQGKTGTKEIVRVHWIHKTGIKGSIDCTPDHKFRLIDGTYKEAQYLTDDDRILAGARRYNDRISFTGYSSMLEHRFVYEQCVGSLSTNDVVHHKDGNHFNNDPSNLEKMTLSEHSRIHAKQNKTTPEARKSTSVHFKRLWKNGICKPRYGEQAGRYLNLSKYFCLKALARNGGMVKITSNAIGVDFGTFKYYLGKYGIDWKIVKLRYDKNGKCISKKRLLELAPLGRSKVQKILGHNHYKLIELYEYYGVDTKRKWKNQCGAFTPNNHRILKVEWLHKKVDVYDIEVDECHNFIVNELCVHNSSYNPNFQNIPKRNPEIKNMIRSGIVPREGNVLGEMDFSGAEISVSCYMHKDPTFIAYQTEGGGDMHKDATAEILIIKPEEVPKQARQATKGVWTFAQFYGSYYKSCAKKGWSDYPLLVDNDGNTLLINGVPIDKYMIQKFGSYKNFENHLQKFEDKFWNEWFKVYTEWKKKIAKEYEKKGYIETPFGFRFKGLMDERKCTNYIVQGSSFHLLLYTIYKFWKECKKRGLNTLIIGQIHDSLVLDIPLNELEEVHSILKQIVGSLHKKFKWMDFPMGMDFEVSKTRKEGGNFAQMEKMQ